MERDLNSETLRSDVREHIHEQLGEDVEVQFVEARDRVDVRLSDLGIVDALKSEHEDLAVTSYSDYRFTVQFD